MEVLDLLEFLIGGFLWTVGGFFADLILEAIFPGDDDDDGCPEEPPPKGRRPKPKVSSVRFRGRYVAALPGFLAATALLSSCSTTVDDPNLKPAAYGTFLGLSSKSDPEFSVDDLNHVLYAVVLELPAIEESLAEVVFYPRKEVDLFGRHRLRGSTDLDGRRVFWSTGLYDHDQPDWYCYGAHSHEIFHVYFYETFWNTDYDHEEGYGPWTEETNQQITRIRERCLND